MDGVEIIETKFLTRLAEKSLADAFAVTDMTADSSIPVPWKNLLVSSTLLEIKVSVSVYYVKMYHRVEKLMP